MDIGEFHNKVNEPQVTQLIDNVLDAVLALKARLAGLEHGFEFHWGCKPTSPVAGLPQYPQRVPL